MALWWLFTSASIYQRREARRLMRGEATRVSLELTSGAIMRGLPNRPLALIGTTSRFVFLFRTDEWRTEIIPLENVQRILPEDALPSKTRAAREGTLQRLDSAGGAAR